MGWFNDQLKQRIKTDRDSFENSFVELSSVVLGRSSISASLNSDKKKAKNAIEEILRYYKAEITNIPGEVVDMNEQLDYLLRPTGIMRRVVHLKGNWWKDAFGPMIGQTVNGEPVALIPYGISGYKFFDYSSGKMIKLSHKTKNMIQEEAFCFYKPFPLKKLRIRDLMKYILQSLNAADFIMIAVITLILQLIGMISPVITKLLYDKVLPTGQVGLLLPFTCLMIGMIFSQVLISITSSLIQGRIGTKLSLMTESASMSRILSLPPTFFKKYSSGELANRVSKVQTLCSLLSSTIFGTGISTLFSFMYLFQMYHYASELVIPGLLIVFIQITVTTVYTLLLLRISRKQMKISAKLTGLIYALFSGIQKIKLAGAERRAFSKWANEYKEGAELAYNPPLYIKIRPIVSGIISMIGSLIFYYIAGANGIRLADYMAFMQAFGAVSGALVTISSLATKFAEIKPIMEMVEPILNEEPEVSDNKQILTKISGGIEINNISFRYSDNSPIILDDFSLKIRPGQYIAIVGKTGCGKSTLIRLLLGFEKPQKGAIYYDGKDINKIDLKSLRKHIGAVMQNGKLFQGDIFSNIIISAPWLSLNDAWEAAKLASIDEDIKEMPMGMHTIISEGSGGVSGGQKQRLMIARAVAPKPNILIFDEATSALDNITQKQISESLDSLKSTRIVIAHRLSTIKNCDRIIVLDKGKIIEDGTYDELILNNGYFAELVKRQMIEQPE